MKAVKDDAFVTDRFLYSLIMKYGRALLRREDSRAKLMRISSLFTTIPCIELIDTSPIEACCLSIPTGCYIKRTKVKLPGITDGVHGPIFRLVSSVDRSQEVYQTDAATYERMLRSVNFKYNKKKYFWYIDGYLYFPNLDWDSVLIEGLFDDDTSAFQCDPALQCVMRQDQDIAIPDYLFAEIENMAKADLGISAQLPTDGADDKQNVLR